MINLTRIRIRSQGLDPSDSKHCHTLSKQLPTELWWHWLPMAYATTNLSPEPNSPRRPAHLSQLLAYLRQYLLPPPPSPVAYSLTSSTSLLVTSLQLTRRLEFSSSPAHLTLLAHPHLPPAHLPPAYLPISPAYSPISPAYSPISPAYLPYPPAHSPIPTSCLPHLTYSPISPVISAHLTSLCPTTQIDDRSELLIKEAVGGAWHYHCLVNNASV
jgi:hypothetical protein